VFFWSSGAERYPVTYSHPLVYPVPLLSCACSELLVVVTQFGPQLRQGRHPDCNPSRFALRHALSHRGSALSIVAEIDVGDRKPSRVLDGPVAKIFAAENYALCTGAAWFGGAVSTLLDSFTGFGEAGEQAVSGHCNALFREDYFGRRTFATGPILAAVSRSPEPSV
jgi:hypothetical protein